MKTRPTTDYSPADVRGGPDATVRAILLMRLESVIALVTIMVVLGRSICILTG